VRTPSTINRALSLTHFENQDENVKENPKGDGLSDGETLVTDRENLGGRSYTFSFKA
jgi:hypothetical protein